MCSFLVTSRKILNLKKLNSKLKFRGPDGTNYIIKNNIECLHNLLHINGKKTLQPFIQDNIMTVFNGEIYNYKELNNNYESDGYCIIDCYKKYGELFTQKLYGEFAIVLIDFNSNKIIISSDIFATKPCYLSLENKDFGICTYKYFLEELNFSKIHKIEPNTIYKIDMINFKIDICGNVHKFNLKQFKNNFNDFENALLKSIEIRTNNNENKNLIFTTLSSGYDSGILSCLLNKLKINFSTYTLISKSENSETINKRIKLICKYCKSYKYSINETQFFMNKSLLMKKIDKYEYNLNDKVIYNILNDDASIGLSYLFEKAQQNKNKIYLSGQGPDEIFSDYGFNGIKLKDHSCFGGKFPKELKSIFPWLNFYKGSQQCFINKEEYVGGCFGIENRYPFLDKNVVQEFLWLKPELKNKNYKSPLYYLLKKYNFPFDENYKSGFSNFK